AAGVLGPWLASRPDHLHHPLANVRAVRLLEPVFPLHARALPRLAKSEGELSRDAVPLVDVGGGGRGGRRNRSACRLLDSSVVSMEQHPEKKRGKSVRGARRRRTVRVECALSRTRR